MIQLNKLKKGDKVAILSPSFAAPGKWPKLYELGLKNLRDVFGLEPIEFPTTKKLGASAEDRAKDLIDAFENTEIKAVITSIGGNDQETYVKNLSPESFLKNPKPFFGFSDNTHFANFLWLNGVPSYYGGSLFTQFAIKNMDALTIKYLNYALFESGERELESGLTYNDIVQDWGDSANMERERVYESNEGWYWDGNENAKGISWGGCIESMDELLRHGIQVPSLTDFENVILITESSEEIPSADYVFRVYRALGERGILARVKGVLVGRPKAWERDNRKTAEEKKEYKEKQREAILRAVRLYNSTVSVIQNLDFGHTNPQVALPYGSRIRIDSREKKIFANF